MHADTCQKPEATVMESNVTLLGEKLRCSICSKTFTDPVILRCGHSFCKGCLEGPSHQMLVLTCPCCGKNIKKHSPLNNTNLKDVCEVFEEKRRKISAEDEGTVCVVHGLKPKLFSTADQKLLCLNCVLQDYPNQFCPISKAAEEHRKKIESPLQELQSKMQNLTSTNSTFSNMVKQLETQTKQTEMAINKVFMRLHQFLKEEQEARLALLREEQQKKREEIMEKIAEVEGLQTSLSERIEKIKDDLEGDDIDFIQHFKSIEDRTHFTVTIPQLDSPCMIDEAKHIGNLKYQVWEKMKDICPYYPVILDPNTKTPSLEVSPDLTSVTCSEAALKNSSGKRFCHILGSEGFGSGVHTWQVDVEACEHWTLGVVDESATKKLQSLSNCPFIIFMKNGKCSWSPTASKIKKVCVHLDMEEGQVAFTDPDTNTTLKSYTVTFTEKMYPCYSLFGKFSLTILPSKVSVSL